MRRHLMACLAVVAVVAQTGAATAQATPDESALGTVEVDGSATNGLAPLTKVAVVPLVSGSEGDVVTRHVVRRDLELSGQFEVLAPEKLPAGPFLRDAPVDVEGFAKSGAELIVRVAADATTSGLTLVGDVFSVKDKAHAPLFHTSVAADAAHVRAAAHRLTDALLGGLTGRPGGFASRLVYTVHEGRDRRAYVVDADGFALEPMSPPGVTVLSPAFGPEGRVYYAMSRDETPFRLAAGREGTAIPWNLPGSLLGLAFSEDRQRLALVTMDDGASHLWMAEHGQLSELPTAPLAYHPALGPLGKVAYVAGAPLARVFVDGKPISPPGFVASAPAFCDAPEGLLVLFAVSVGAGSDIVSSDARGAALRRLTGNRGRSTSPACSPDGRLVAFFADGARGPGLYVMPIARPWLAKRVSDQLGDGLRWDRAQP